MTKTHYRKAFDSPYLSSADIVEPTVLTIAHVALEPDRTKKTKDVFNTAFWVEKEIFDMKLKPMILNMGNCKVLKAITGSSFIQDWNNIRLTVFVDPNVRFGKEITGGLVLRPIKAKPVLTPENERMWENAKAAYRRDGNLDSVLERVDISEEHQQLLKKDSGFGIQDSAEPALNPES